MLTFSGNLKAYLCDCRFQPFALVGIGLSWASVDVPFLCLAPSATEFAARFGGGFDFYLTENWSLSTTGSYVPNTGSVDGFDWISLVMGAQYRF